MDLLIDYKCYNCDWEWQEIYSTACDSECHGCGAKNVQANKWEELNAPL